MSHLRKMSLRINAQVSRQVRLVWIRRMRYSMMHRRNSKNLLVHFLVLGEGEVVSAVHGSRRSFRFANIYFLGVLSDVILLISISREMKNLKMAQRNDQIIARQKVFA